MHRLGVTTLDNWDPRWLSLTLGGGEVKLLEMVGAYATIAREGDAVVGTSVLDLPVERGLPWTAYTGTSRSVRGRGIARALKYESISQALEAGLTMHADWAARAGVTLGLALDPDDIRICADERKLRQVVFNLLSNAVKFTPEGGWVTLKAACDGHDLVFTVSDRPLVGFIYQLNSGDQAAAATPGTLADYFEQSVQPGE